MRTVRAGSRADGVPALSERAGEAGLRADLRRCWAEWLKTQQQLINHYSLNLRDPQAKEFLFRNMEQFLFAPASGRRRALRLEVPPEAERSGRSPGRRAPGLRSCRFANPPARSPAASRSPATAHAGRARAAWCRGSTGCDRRYWRTAIAGPRNDSARRRSARRTSSAGPPRDRRATACSRIRARPSSNEPRMRARDRTVLRRFSETTPRPYPSARSKSAGLPTGRSGATD